MMSEAQEHAGEDKKRRELVEARNHADAAVHQIEKALKEHGEKVGQTERSAIEAAVVAVKDAVKGDDAEMIRTKTDALHQASLKLGEAIYKGMSPEGGAPEGPAGDAGGGASTDGDGNVVDADYEEVDEEKKKKGGAR